jgi:tripartite ATP-independent transporter DctM subunit
VEVLRALLPPLGLILAVLGSIAFGVATPAEAGGLGAFGTILLAAANRRLDWAALKETCYATAQTTAFVFLLILAATCFAIVLRGLGGDEVIAGAFTALSEDPQHIVLLILGLVFLLGFVMDWIEITLIVMPLTIPVLKQLGVDPLWFTILVAVTLQTSFLTPPVAGALFFLKGAAPPQVTLGHIYRGVIPFVLLQILTLALVFEFPAIATWLPGLGP